MAATTMLDVVNALLGTLGEAPLNDLDEDHPLTAAAVRTINTVLRQEQAREWWFNREVVTLYPDPETGFFYTPQDAINVDPVASGLNYVMRGRRLYDARNATYVIPQPSVKVNLVRELPFEDLPPLFQAWVSVCARLQFQADFDGDENKYQKLLREKAQVQIDLNSEHIRNVQANLLHTPSLARKLSRVGGMKVGTNPTIIGG